MYWALKSLTTKGEEVLAKLKAGYADAYNRDGDLTALGGRQHREIAHRMYDRFPELLSQPLQVDARASTSRRVMISMFNFCWELQGLNPDLDIRMDASEHDMPFVVSDSRVKPEVTEEAEAIHKKFSAYRDDAYSKPERLMKVLFKDVRKVEAFVDGPDLMKSLYNVAQDFQNVPELGLSMTDIFTKEELFRKKIAVTPQFSVSEIRLMNPVRIGAENNGSFLLYACVKGAGSLEVEGMIPLVSNM